jgi:F-box/WD-40 domain protein MET30
MGETNHLPSAPTKHRTWKQVYAERLVLERNWRQNNYRQTHIESVTILTTYFDECGCLMTGDTTGAVKVWRLKEEGGNRNFALERIMKHSTHAVNHVMFDCEKIASSSMDGTMKVWSWQTGEAICTFQNDNSQGEVHPVCGMGAAKRLMLIGNDFGQVKVMSCRTTPPQIFSMQVMQGMLFEIIFVPGDDSLALCVGVKNVLINWTERRIVREYPTFAAPANGTGVFRAQFIMRKNAWSTHPVIIGLSADRKLLVCDFESTELLESIDLGHYDCVCFVATTSRIILGDLEGLIIWYDIAKKKIVHSASVGSYIHNIEVTDTMIICGTHTGLFILDYAY